MFEQQTSVTRQENFDWNKLDVFLIIVRMNEKSSKPRANLIKLPHLYHTTRLLVFTTANCNKRRQFYSDNISTDPYRCLLKSFYWTRFCMSFKLRKEKVWWTISYVRDIYTLSAVKSLYLFLCPLNSFTQAPVSRFHSDTIVPDPTARWPWR